jgi:hypothetical protein
VWETIFVAVNIGQLIILWYYERHHTFAEDQRHFIASMPPGVERRIRSSVCWNCRRSGTGTGGRDADHVEGEVVNELIFITRPASRYDRAQRRRGRRMRRPATMLAR